MKDIQTFIRDFGVDVGSRLQKISEQLLCYFDVLPATFRDDPYRDYVIENLNSHSIKVLRDKLKDIFGVEISEYTNKYNSSFYIDYFDGNIEYLRRILDFYGWYITYIEENTISIEAKYTTDKTEYVHNVCHDVVYHICRTADVKSIMHNGLRCKTGRNNYDKYREFPSRIFVIADSPSSVRYTIRDVLSELKHNDLSKLSILKIRSSNIFYEDTAMDNEHTFFTYTNIPANNIIATYNLKDFLEHD